MSRIGNSPITVPSGVDVSVSGLDVTVKGPKGSLTHTIPETISVDVGDDQVSVARQDDERQSKAMHLSLIHI